MAITKEQVLKILEEISLEKDSAEIDYSEDDFKSIYREAFIEYEGIEGRLVWDDLGFNENELIFIENESGRHYSLGKTKHNSEVNEVFYSLSKEYGRNDYKCCCRIAVIYENKEAREAAASLNAYLCSEKFSTILLSAKECVYLKDDKHNQLKTSKEIILGHNAWSKKKVKSLGGQEIGKGMKIAYNNNRCILMADRSAFEKGKAGRTQFGLYYQKEINELESSAKELNISIDFDANKRTTVSMYNFLVTVFVEKEYMDDFLEKESTEDFTDSRDELCKELQNNQIYQKYITPNLLNEICEKEKFFVKPPKSRKNENENAWKDLYKSDYGIWSVQRYWIKDYCRIFNIVNQTQAHGTVEQILRPILEHCHRKELLEKIQKREWGIVFCGGGGKGAYQIGVWKWLIEHGVADKITGVSGASVGALNSLLFVEGDYDLAEKVWYSVTPDVIMDQNKIPFLQNQDVLSELLKKYMDGMENVCKQEKIVYSALTCLNGIPLNAALGYRKNKIVMEDETIKSEYYCWASRKKEEIREIVLASAALPVLKKSREFEGEKFVDGGFTDNVPVRPLVEDGFRNIMVVHLNKSEKAFQKAIVNLDIANVKFYHVRPSESLGDMRIAGAAPTKARIKLGYEDADRQLKEILSI